MTSFERLEIYNRQYWFRLFSSFTEDFPGLQAVVGMNRFQRLMRAYLEACPSTSFSLRNLGSQLLHWLQQNPEWVAPDVELAQQMATLEWAHIEAFDSATWPVLTSEMLGELNAESRIALQPHLRLVKADYAVDDALIRVRSETGSSNGSSNSASVGHHARRLRALRKLPREKVYIAVHRYEDTVYYRRLSAEAFSLLQSLQNGEALGDAIDNAFLSSTIDDVERPSYLQGIFRDSSAMGWCCIKPGNGL